ncbi:MAG TPA: RraA family protein [Steroidobacteraceae bacterium]|jgi:regulator of RNase E activity RraA
MLTTAQLDALRSLDTCTVANAVETFGERLRNEGFADNTIRSLFPELPPMVGYAVTMKVRGSAPPTASGPYADRTDWWEYVLTVPEPRVLVIQDVATQPGLGALIGEVHMNILRALHCVGVVTNGSVRDLTPVRRDGFHFFAGGAAVSHGYVHIVEFGQAVKLGGLTVHPGDLMHGDQHGVQTVPLAIADQVPAAAGRIAANESAVIQLCRSREFSLEKLRALLARQKL